MRNSVRFALVGIAAGVAVPLAVVIYALLVDRTIDPMHLVTVTTAAGTLALGLAGWAMGRKDDLLAAQNRSLRELSQRLQALSTTDPLTGVPNRRALDERLEAELERSKRHGIPLAVVMIDIDHFKRFNDRYGHPAGDAVLREVARLLDSEKRKGDTVARYGGEEFVAVLSHADATAAQGWAERVRARIESTALDLNGTLLRIEASFGVAATAGRVARGPSPVALLETADRALYAAKAGGRNRVAVAPSPAEDAGSLAPSNRSRMA